MSDENDPRTRAREVIVTGSRKASKMVQTVQGLQARYEARIRNQVQAIDRLLKDGSYDEEMRALHERVAMEEARSRLAEDFIHGKGKELYADYIAYLGPRLPMAAAESERGRESGVSEPESETGEHGDGR